MRWCKCRSDDFNPRPPRGGRPWRSQTDKKVLFNFNPRPPRGGRRSNADVWGYIHSISIHALREEGDRTPEASVAGYDHFNPRPPRGGRQYILLGAVLTFSISIHALREEGDIKITNLAWYPNDFNPRPPRGGRQQKRRKNPPRLFHYTHLCTI